MDFKNLKMNEMFWLKPIEIIYDNHNYPAKAGGNELPQALACGG